MYSFSRPALTSDIILFRYNSNQLQTLLIQRKQEPFKDSWAYPGGFVDEGETALQAAHRELYEETSIEIDFLYELFTDSEKGRDPRGWTVSIVYYGFVKSNVSPIAGDDAKKALWFNINEVPKLAFDHNLLYNKSLEKISELIVYKVFGYELLPNSFSLKDLKNLYQIVLLNKKRVKRVIIRLAKYKIIRKKYGKFQFHEEAYLKIMLMGFL